MLSVHTLNHDFLGIPTESGLSLAKDLFKYPAAETVTLSLQDQLAFIKAKGCLPHPNMNRSTTNMHEDAYATDVTAEAGPVEGDSVPELVYKEYRGSGTAKIGMISTLAYDLNGRIIAIGARSGLRHEFGLRTPDGVVEWLSAIHNPAPSQFVGLTLTGETRFSLLVLDPRTLETIGERVLPARPVRRFELSVHEVGNLSPRALQKLYDNIFFDEGTLFNNTAGGAYFFLDNQDQAVIPASDGALWRVDTRSDDLPFLRIEIPGLQDEDAIVGTAPVWYHREHYWYTTRLGKIGVATPAGVLVEYDVREYGEEDETINNSFPAGPDGAFIVTSRAMYRFDFPENPAEILVNPERLMVWRSPYQNDNIVKCGQLPPPGSGTTPTLMGERYVAISDNAHRMNVVVYDRRNGHMIGEMEAFPEAEPGNSACDNSLVSYGFSIWVGNTHCYAHPFVNRPRPTGGMTRFDVNPDTDRLRMRWTNPNIYIWSAVPKLSSATGLIYIYSRETGEISEGTEEEPQWRLQGIDAMGNIRLSISIASREKITWLDISSLREEKVDRYDNGWGPLYVGLNAWGDRTVLMATIQGLLRISV